jgi:hypothetical protein
LAASAVGVARAKAAQAGFENFGTSLNKNEKKSRICETVGESEDTLNFERHLEL